MTTESFDEFFAGLDGFGPYEIAELWYRDLLKLDSARAAAAPAKHVAIVTNNNQPGWTNIVETAPNVTLHVGTKLYDESALIGVGVALVEQRAAEIIDLEYRLGERTKKCEWLSPTAVDYDAWQTGCGQEFIFSSDGPLENSFKFCPYCGGEMTITDRLEGDDVPR